MKRILAILTIVIIFCMQMITCLAGDVPEGLLSNDESLVYFGEVKEIKENRIEVIVTENIKGISKVNQIYEYEDWVFTDAPQVGEIYLCGYFDENNPLYVWEVSSTDLETLDIKNEDDMANRMEEYINNGDFTKAQEELLSNDEEETNSIGIIGSADGPTSIYVSGSGVSGIVVIGICIAGVIVFGIVAVIIGKKIRKK